MLTIRKGDDSMKLRDKLINKKTVNARELGQLLTAKGFELVRTKGDHKIYKKDDKTVTVNLRNLNRMVAQRIIKENNLFNSDSESENRDEKSNSCTAKGDSLEPELCFAN